MEESAASGLGSTGLKTQDAYQDICESNGQYRKKCATNDCSDRFHTYPLSGMGHGCRFQISRAYSAMVRSLENRPEPATFRMALRAQSSGLAYSASRRPSASR